MEVSYCLLYRNGQSGQISTRLSMAYLSLDLAINAAIHITQKKLEPIEIRGTDGTIIKTPELMKAIEIYAA